MRWHERGEAHRLGRSFSKQITQPVARSRIASAAKVRQNTAMVDGWQPGDDIEILLRAGVERDFIHAIACRNCVVLARARRGVIDHMGQSNF